MSAVGVQDAPETARLWASQQAELEHLRRHPKALLLSAPGAGKTPVMLTYGAERMDEGDRVLWITKAGLLDQLTTETRRWLPDGCPQPVPFDGHSSGDRFVMVSYEKLERYLADGFGDALAGLRFDVVIADEAHAIKGGGATWDAFRSVTARVPRVVLATATPVTGVAGTDLINLLHAGRFADVPTQETLAGYFNRDNYGNVVSVNDAGVRMLAGLARRYGIRHLGDDAALPTITQRGHRLTPATQTAPVPRPPRGQRAGSDHDQRQASHDPSALVPEVVALLCGEYAQHEKCVVFTENRDVLEPLAEALRAEGVGVLVFDRTATAKQRAELIERHRSDSTIRVLLGTAAVEEGLNLQHASLLMTVVDSYSPAREDQREGRIRRPGSPHAEVLHAVVVLDTTHQGKKARRGATKAGLAEAVQAAVLDGETLSALLEAASVPCCTHGPRRPASGISKRYGTPFMRWDCAAGRCPPDWHNEPATWDALAATAKAGRP